MNFMTTTISPLMHDSIPDWAIVPIVVPLWVGVIVIWLRSTAKK